MEDLSLHLLHLYADSRKGGDLDYQRLIAELKTERDRLNKAIAALDGMSTHGKKRKGFARVARRRKHNISAAGRKRLSLMMKRRWAERRKKGKAA